jgi:hypothetical protein
MMNVPDAQREMRTVYLGGSVGQAVSGTIWLISAALGTWISPQAGMVSLFLIAFFTFPITQLALKLAGLPATLQSGNPLQSLARQVAFMVPLCLPVIIGATLYRESWFYPAFSVVVGAHYLPFVFLYGMWQYALLGGLLIAAGVGIGMLLPGVFSLCGWVTGALLVVFSVWLRLSSKNSA